MRQYWSDEFFEEGVPINILSQDHESKLCKFFLLKIERINELIKNNKKD